MTDMSQLPVSVALLETIAQRLQFLLPVMNVRSEAFKAFRTFIQSDAAWEDIPQLDPVWVRYVLTMGLMSFSMSGGIQCSDITGLVQHEGWFLQWHDGQMAAIPTAEATAKDIPDIVSLLNLKFPYEEIAQLSVLFKIISEQLSDYLRDLHAADEKLSNLLAESENVKGLLKKEPDLAYVTMLMSCLPVDQLQYTLRHIQKFFPEDLAIKNRQGKAVLICPYFSAPTAHVTELIERVYLYQKLVENKRMPIIAHITRTKTAECILEFMQNPAIRQNVLQNLMVFKETALRPRQVIYSTFLLHLQCLTSTP